MDCIFCKIINNEIPSYTLYEDENVKCILDINPISKGHTLIIPKKHFKDIVDIDSSTQNETGDILNAKVINTQYPEEVEVKLYPMVKIGKCQFSLEDCLNLIKRGIQV